MNEDELSEEEELPEQDEGVENIAELLMQGL